MESGIMVFGKTELDNKRIEEFILGVEGFYAEYDNEFKCFTFEETEDMYDALEKTLEELFVKYDINARFEGIFESKEISHIYKYEIINTNQSKEALDEILDLVNKLNNDGLDISILDKSGHYSGAYNYINSIYVNSSILLSKLIRIVNNKLGNDFKYIKIIEVMDESKLENKLGFKSFNYWLNYAINESKSESSKLNDFLAKFPDNATSWSQATQELSQMYLWLTERYNDIMDKEILKPVGKENIKTPAEHNTKYKIAIKKALKLIDKYVLKEFYDNFSHWINDPIFNKNINETNKLRHVTVKYDSGDNIDTNMAAHLTDDEIKKYYKIGKEFNIGNSGHDKMAKVTDVIINESNKILNTFAGVIPEESTWTKERDKDLANVNMNLVTINDKLFQINDMDFMKVNIGKAIRFKYDSSKLYPLILQPKLMVTTKIEND